jgi:hypothetical protein
MTYSNSDTINKALLKHFKSNANKRKARPQKYKSERLQISVEVKDIISTHIDNDEGPYFNICLECYDGIEYYLQIDPADFLSWFGPNRIKDLKKKALRNLEKRIGNE